ncbi:hypothetical protein [Sporosarcina ureilytica]|uniref:hypothetical protein n=1 Tax=Sporosarcina ureilytica TaxID=298596 RepID=UPI001439D749|nr:hypothetical protein [Sporosarcina ureilytica]
MICGSKCFLVEVALNGEKQIKRVRARTPVSARKVIRRKYGYEVVILSSVEEKK